MLEVVNAFKDDIAGRIQQSRPEVFNLPATDDLVADRREYAFPSTVLNNLVRLEIKFSSSGDYVWAEPISLNHFREPLQESIIVAHFDNENPRYFLRRKAIYILSGAIVAVTSGLRLVFNAFPDDLANVTGAVDLSVDPSTTTLGFPKEFHELLARRVSMEYKDRNKMALSRAEQRYEDDLETKLNEFSTANLDEEIIGALPSAESRGNEGELY